MLEMNPAFGFGGGSEESAPACAFTSTESRINRHNTSDFFTWQKSG